MQSPAPIETAVVHPRDFCRRRMSLDETVAHSKFNNDCDITRHPHTTRSCASAASPTRVRFIYEDEDAKARVCGNVQQLLNVVQDDPGAISTNAQVARKVLKYRRIMGKLDNMNVEDPDFDASAFFGIEWCHVGAPSS
ncbi:unnamed protein product [Peronospora destructor]|uniref:Uncharacterized protein n=1 Tax=Peronospora destructor TaxID=86335 RepID=A0AAV0TWJ2_9STRA|nr:unnamed protein product [Peronospora destructor]